MFKYCAILLIATLYGPAAAQQNPQSAPVSAQAQCEGLLNFAQLTISRAELRPASPTAPSHCYIQGTIASRIRFHMQLPLPENWNGRLLNIGDGGKDGQLDFADNRLAQGYAVANSNSVTTAPPSPGQLSLIKTSMLRSTSAIALYT